MEWNGNGYGTHGLVTTMVDWALGSGWRLSLSLDDDDDDVILPSYPHRHTRTFVPCLHTSSAACYTGLRRLAVMDDDGVWRSVDDRRPPRPGYRRASHGWPRGLDVTLPHRPCQRRHSGIRCTYVWHDLSPCDRITDRREHGIPNTARVRGLRLGPTLGTHRYRYRRPK